MIYNVKIYNENTLLFAETYDTNADNSYSYMKSDFSIMYRLLYRDISDNKNKLDSRLHYKLREIVLRIQTMRSRKLHTYNMIKNMQTIEETQTDENTTEYIVTLKKITSDEDKNYATIETFLKKTHSDSINIFETLSDLTIKHTDVVKAVQFYVLHNDYIDNDLNDTINLILEKYAELKTLLDTADFRDRI